MINIFNYLRIASSSTKCIYISPYDQAVTMEQFYLCEFRQIYSSLIESTTNASTADSPGQA